MHAVIKGVCLCLLMVSQTAAPVEGSPRKIFPYPIHQTVLDNGFKVISIPFDSPGIVSYYTVVRAGSRNEVEPGLSGFAHFFEHMMFRGTERYSKDQYNQALKSIGADNNAFTTDDYTAYHTLASADALDTIMDVESDRFKNLKYSVEDFKTEAGAILGEYNKNYSSPIQTIFEKLNDAAYQVHTYKHTTMGFLKDIQDMPNQYDYSLKFLDRWYRPEHSALIVVGDVKHPTLVESAKQYYGSWKRGSYTLQVPVEPPQTEERLVEVSWKAQTLPILAIGYHGPAFSDSTVDMPAMDLLSQVVFSQASDLFRQLVIEEQLVEFVQGGQPDSRDAGMFTIFTRIKDPKNIERVRKAVYAAIDEAKTKPVAAERLAEIKSHLKYDFAMRLDNADAIARTISHYVQLTGEPDAVNRVYEMYDRVSPQDILMVANKYFSPNNRTVVLLKQEDAFKKERKFNTVKNNNQIPAKEREPVRRSLSRFQMLCSLGGLLMVLPQQAAGQPHPQTPGDSRPSKIRTTEIQSPNSPLITLRLILRAGSVNDPKGREGLNALTAYLLAQGGSKDLTYQEVIAKLYPWAASIDVQPDKEITTFIANVHRDHLDKFYPLFSSLLLSPRFDPEDFTRNKDLLLNHLEKGLRGTDDENLGKEALNILMFGDHPYGTADATVQGLKSITLEDVKQYYTRTYTRARIWLGIAGGYPQTLVDRIQKDFGALPQGDPAPEPLPHPRKIEGLEMLFVEKPARATAISMGHPLAITRNDKDFYPLLVANSYFGEHRTFNGVLMNRLRGDRGLNYGDYSYIEKFTGGVNSSSRFPHVNTPLRQQFFSIWIRPVPPEKAHFALRAALYELDKFVERGLTEEQFQQTRRFLINYSKLWAQTLDRRLGYKMDSEFYGSEDYIDRIDKELKGLTVADVNKAIRKHVSQKNLKIAVVAEQAQQLMDAIASNAPSPISYDSPVSERILEDDKVISKFPLAVNKSASRVIAVKELFENKGL